jgi:hypothetical protein
MKFAADVPESTFREIVDSALEFVPEARWIGPTGKAVYVGRRDEKIDDKEPVESS